MGKKTTMLMCGLIAFGLTASAQETKPGQLAELEKRTEKLDAEIAKQKKLKVSGYIQTQWQWGEEAASLKVGSGNENSSDSFNRFGIRRGRLKFVYEEKIGSAVFQLDITEKGVKFKDAYLNIKDPWLGAFSLRGGIFDRPFGNEISYSSSRRESPERSTVFQTLFPDERDLGAMLIFQAPNKSSWSILKLEAGLFAGNGIQLDTDNQKDFIGHLSLAKTVRAVSFGLGASYYNGKVYQTNNNVYTEKGGSFVLNDAEANKGGHAKREYFGFDAQFSIKSGLGLTQLRGEYLFGQQPGTDKSTKSPNYSSFPDPGTDTYIRDFSGWYVILVQDIGRTPFSAVLKYDSYDPNTKVSGNGVDSGKGFKKADLAQNTLGFGLLWHINSALRLQAFYEINRNEQSTGIEGMNKDLNNEVFTLRLQYKF